MSKYLTFIPLLREMCFPYYHSCLEKKNNYDSGKLKFLCIFFWYLSKYDLGYEHETMHSPFPEEKMSSFILHLSSLASFFVLHAFLFLCRDRMSPYPVRKAGFIHPLIFIYFNLFYIYFCLYGERQDGSHFTWRAASLLSSATFVWFLSFSILSILSQYLPVLSKCYCKVFQWDDSKYVYINRGNTLGYILLTYCVVWSVHCLLIFKFDSIPRRYPEDCKLLWNSSILRHPMDQVAGESSSN